MNWLRNALETWSRDRVIRRQLPGEFGARMLFVSPDASLRFWRPNLAASDEGLLALAAELVRPGERVWDIGASVGLFSFAAAHRAGSSGTVLALEADPWLAALMRRTEEGAAPLAARASVLAAAVADTNGVAELVISCRGRSSNHLAAVSGSTQTGGVRAIHPVVTITLDTLLDRFGPPTLVKIDVEGAEALCLRAAERLLRHTRPRLLCEVSAENVQEVTAMLRGHSYRIFDASQPPGLRSECHQAVWATLALPDTLPPPRT
jgi:FkbM family methyltransferase